MPPSKHAAKTPEVTLRRLLRAWNAGDEEAGRQLFELLADDVTRFFRSKLFDQHAVEDLVQETFLKVRVANSEVHTTARGFVFGVAFNTLRHHLRGRQRAGVRHQRLADALDSGTYVLGDHEIDPEYVLGMKQERRLLMKSMRRIPLDDQVMLELHYMQSLSRREMAEIFQRKEPTIAGQLRRARRRLAAKMAEVAQSREVLLSTSKSAASWLHELAQHLGAMTSERA